MELNPEGVNDKNSQSTEVCVSVIERETRKVLKGEEAPSSAELSSWLEAHPGWEVKEDDDDDESVAGPTAVKPPVVELQDKDTEAVPVEHAKKIIQQAKSKVEDDECKNQMG
ncbi:unnamed protein product [Orchesella dallaii]|uniref:BRK domain-containing protein n=1 Tax=Orchesella dallaii TaxID=48710 RepID=A0ABP1SB47_9HEXA